MTLIQDATFISLDTETTGLDPSVDQVVEVAAVWTSLAGGITRTWSSLVNPGRPIPASASAVHHLVDEDVADAPKLEVALGELKRGDFQAVACHNAAFDTAFIPFEVPVLCTMRLAQRLWPELESHKNQFLRYHLKLNCPEVKGLAAHRAEVDALVTAKLLIFELEEVLRRAKDPGAGTVEGLVEWVNKPLLLHKCNFGKHRGSLWSEIPKDYLAWMNSPKGITDMSADTRYTVQVYLGLTERV